MQGAGQALIEEIVYDENGELLTSTLADYQIPASDTLPVMVWARTETPTYANPLGVKGIGEAGSIAATPAIVNAVEDALSGVRGGGGEDAGQAGLHPLPHRRLEEALGQLLLERPDDLLHVLVSRRVDQTGAHTRHHALYLRVGRPADVSASARRVREGEAALKVDTSCSGRSPSPSASRSRPLVVDEGELHVRVPLMKDIPTLALSEKLFASTTFTLWTSGKIVVTFFGPSRSRRPSPWSP